MNKVAFDKSKTKENLANAYAGECLDGARYQFLARLSEAEGYSYLKLLLKTLAKNELAHAKRFYDLIINNCDDKCFSQKISGEYPFCKGGLIDLLEDKICTEKNQSQKVYTSFSQIADSEGYPEIAKAFDFCASIENCHYMLLTQVCDKLKSGNLYKSNTEVKWKCGVCGFEHTDKEAWECCPSCGAEQGYVQIQVDVNKN